MLHVPPTVEVAVSGARRGGRGEARACCGGVGGKGAGEAGRKVGGGNERRKFLGRNPSAFFFLARGRSGGKAELSRFMEPRCMSVLAAGD